MGLRRQVCENCHEKYGQGWTDEDQNNWTYPGKVQCPISPRKEKVPSSGMVAVTEEEIRKNDGLVYTPYIPLLTFHFPIDIAGNPPWHCSFPTEHKGGQDGN